MAGAVHLAKRFFGSLNPGGPPADAEAWVAGQLGDGELRLWQRMSGPDRRHAYAVARRVEAALPARDATRPVLAAALLHDVGKVTSGLGTFARVLATLAGKVAGREMAPVWSQQRGMTRRFGLYLRHDALGADLLRMAEADPLTVSWAEEHHKPDDQWTLPRHLADALKAADDD